MERELLFARPRSRISMGLLIIKSQARKGVKSSGFGSIQVNFWRILCQKWLAARRGFVSLHRYNFL
jgi:hypothetical protein